MGHASSRDEVYERARVVFRDARGKGLCEFSVELAVTPAQISRGLMFRKHMAQGQGMLFVFPGDEERTFWMANTYIPLDMIFIDSSRKVVHVHRNAKPHDHSPVNSKEPARYVLEVNAGCAAKCRILPGSMITILSDIR